MMAEYFSDIENGKRERSSENISLEVWKAIIAIYEQYITNCALAGIFSEECNDSPTICGCNRAQLEDALKGEVPDISIPIRKYYDEENIPDKYAILDFLQFVYKNIKDPEIIFYHDYFKHNHYSFSDDGIYKQRFRESINIIFSRNGLVFFLDEDGQIIRLIPLSFTKIIADIRFNTGDARLNELLEIAYSKFILPRPESRIESLEKIWDAFERLKTYFDEKNSYSAKTLIDIISEDNKLFLEMITCEFAELTKAGNNFQIRHFERNKVQVESNLHIDYLFYRMSSLIHLCVESLKPYPYL